MRPRLAPALLLALPFAGCVTVEWNLTGGSWGGEAAGRTSATAAETTSSNVVALTGGDRKQLLLLIEGSASGGVSGGDPPSGTIWTPAGRVVNWSAPSRRGRLVELCVDGTTFPLSAGRVFHIDVRDGRVSVRQIDADPHALASGPGSLRENVRANAAGHPAVADFVSRCEPAE